MNNVIQAAREKEQEAWRKVHDTEAKYQEGGDLMKELEAVRRERDERQANVNELQGKIRRVLRVYTCLLYTSPSPRDA